MNRFLRKVLGCALLFTGLGLFMLGYLGTYFDSLYWFDGTVNVQNDTGRVLTVAPVGRVMESGPRVGVRPLRSPDEWFPRVSPHYRIEPGEAAAIRYDADSAVVTELAVGGDYSHMVVLSRWEDPLRITNDMIVDISDDVSFGAFGTERHARTTMVFAIMFFGSVMIMLTGVVVLFWRRRGRVGSVHE